MFGKWALRVALVTFAWLSATKGIAAPASCADEPFCIWGVHGTTKVRPLDPAPSDPHNEIQIAAAQNEFEPFQILIHANRPLSGVSVTPDSRGFVDAQGKSILSKESLTIYREGYLSIYPDQVAIQSEPAKIRRRGRGNKLDPNNDGTPCASALRAGSREWKVDDNRKCYGEWPDALIPQIDEYVGETRWKTLSVPQGENRGIWVDVYVPPGTPPGRYSTLLRVGTPQLSKTVRVSMTVWAFALPSTPTLRTAFTVSPSGLLQGHLLPNGGEEEARPLIELYTRALLLHRISNSSPPYPQFHDPPTPADWDHFDALWGPFLDGTVSLPRKGAPLPRLPHAHLSAQRLYPLPSLLGPGQREPSLDYYRGYVKHFVEHHWINLLFQYTCDEPPGGVPPCPWDRTSPGFDPKYPDSTLVERARRAHATAPPLPTLVTTSYRKAKGDPTLDYPSCIGGSHTDVTAWIDFFVVPIEALYGKQDCNEGNQRSSYSSLPTLKELWLYQGCSTHTCEDDDEEGPQVPDAVHWGWVGALGYPSYEIDLPAVYHRMMEWISFMNGIRGELYYETVCAFEKTYPSTALGRDQRPHPLLRYGCDDREASGLDVSDRPVWPADPWVNQYFFGGNGDGTLFYPGLPDRIGGRSDIPIESIRLKMIREGIEDYEYLVLAARDPRYGMTWIQENVLPKLYARQDVPERFTPFNWNRDPDSGILAARRILGEALNQGS